MREVPEANNLINEGMSHYGNAMFAVRHFERLVDEILKSILERKMKDLLSLFEIEKIYGGGFESKNPGIEVLKNIESQKWSARIGRSYWVSSRGGCEFYIGLLMEDGRFYAVAGFTPKRAPLRVWLMDVLNRDKKGTATVNNKWEISVIENWKDTQVSINTVSVAIERALDTIMVAIEKAGGWQQQAD